MTGGNRKRLARGAAAIGLLASALIPIALAQAHGSETLQVTREVNTVLGGTSVALTARLSAATPGVKVKFALEGAPQGTTLGTPNPCTTGVDGTCQVTVHGTQLGTALVRAWINDHSADDTEARLANTDTDLLGLNPAADCGAGDDDNPLLQNTCAPSGATANPGAQAEPDFTDVVQVTFSTFVDGHLDCDDANANDGEDAQYNRVDDRSETYTCRLTDTAGHPITQRPIDAAYLTGAAGGNPALMTPALGDANRNFCTTGADGRCSGTINLGGTAADTGTAVVCFWGDGDEDAELNASGNAVDGGGCGEAFDAAEDKDLTDTVKLNVDVPKPTSLDVRPETQSASPGSTFRFTAIVFDQFGNPVAGDAAYTLRTELFAGSALDGNDGNTPASPDITKSCTGPTCPVDTRIQSGLGANLACVWMAGTPAMIGDQLGGSCDDEGLTDASFEDGVPSPVGDDRDVVNFTVRSRPLIATSSPTSIRQDNTTTLVVEGFNFMSGARLSLSGEGLNLASTRFVSEKTLKADLVVPANAPPGARDVIVTNPDGGTATCSGCFRVIGHGYWLVASDGGIFGFGDARFAGSPASRGVNSPVVGMAATPSGDGYWVASADGGVYAQGDAPFLGSAGSVPLSKPIVGLAATPTGRGYWLVASDGGIFAFGDARFYGSTGKISLNKPIVGMTATPNGGGYWLVASDGGIFAFGNASFAGSTGGIQLNQPIVSMAPSKSGKGYWLVASDGGIFAFGDSTFYGSTGDLKLNRPIVGMTTTPMVRGYWLVASDGGIFAFGDAAFLGSTGGLELNKPIVGMARR